MVALHYLNQHSSIVIVVHYKYDNFGNFWTITKSRKCTALNVISSMLYKSDKVFPWTGVSWLKTKQSRQRSVFRSLISVVCLPHSWMQQRIYHITNSSKTNTKNHLAYRNGNLLHPVWYRKMNGQISFEDHTDVQERQRYSLHNLR